MNVLEGRGVTVRYGALTALNRVDLCIPVGAVCGLIGPNGSGKSTLLHALVGRRFPDEGQVLLGGDDITRNTPTERVRRGLSIKFQIARVYPSLTVAENMRLALQSRDTMRSLVRSKTRRQLDQVAAELLQPFQLDTALHQPASELAHGQQQRLELAMAASTNPSVLLLDEPTAGMSADERRATGEWMRSLTATCSILIVDHDLDFVRNVSDQVTVLHQGAHVATGTTEEIERNPDVKRVYLSHV